MILLIGPLPNPIDGCSFANKILLENFKKRQIKFWFINSKTAIVSSQQGHVFSLKKSAIFFKTYFQIYKIFFSKTIYITPGQTFYGLIKYSPFIGLCILLRKPYIIHLHGNYLGKQYGELNGLKRKIFYFLISKAAAGIVLSESLKENFKEFLSKDKIYVVENFVSNDIYKKVENTKKHKDFIRILYLSNLIKEKGVLDLINALLMLNQIGIKFLAKFAGNIDASIENDFKNKLELLKGKVEYLGVIDGELKIKALNESNIFILPTYYKMEGQPISILEGLASGNIIITTKHAGIPDIISSENGFFVESENPNSISEMLLKINNNLENEVEKISTLNSKYAIENFTEEKFSKKIIDIINLVSN